MEPANGVVRPEIDGRIASVADRKPYAVGLRRVEGVFGVHAQSVGRRRAFGGGRIGRRVGIEPFESDQGAVVHVTAEAGFHRRVGPEQTDADDPLGFVGPGRPDGVGDACYFLGCGCAGGVRASVECFALRCAGGESPVGRAQDVETAPHAVLQFAQFARRGTALGGRRTTGNEQQR